MERTGAAGVHHCIPNAGPRHLGEVDFSYMKVTYR